MKASLKLRLARLEKKKLGPGGVPPFDWLDLHKRTPEALRRLSASPRAWEFLGAMYDAEAKAFEEQGERVRAAEARAQAKDARDQAALRWAMYGYSGAKNESRAIES